MPAAVSEPPKPGRTFAGIKAGEEFSTTVESLAGIDPVPAEPAKPAGVTVLIEDLHAVFVMARIAMQPRKEPLRPARSYAESFKRVRKALQDCGRIPT